MSVHQYFYELADTLGASLKGQEIYTAFLSGEDSDFCRLNQAQVRQAGHVEQALLSVRLIDGKPGVDQRSVEASIGLSMVKAEDDARLKTLLQTLREQIRELPADPYLLYATEVRSSETVQGNHLLDARDVIRQVTTKVRSLDLVGIYAAGKLYRGFANSFGQRNWFEGYSFNFDFSFYLRADKAVKAGYAGFQWDAAEFDRKIARAEEQLAILERPSRIIKPGKYRVYLAPQAVLEITDMMSWGGGFGLKSLKTKSTPLLKLAQDGVTMSPMVSFFENTAGGLAPNFNAAGFTKPVKVDLIDKGAYADNLKSARSAKEFGVETNGADASEQPQSLEMAAGDLAMDDAARIVGDGLYINNLWYLNFSDKPACRVTGMTRFASFAVEGGTIVAPLEVMRFDESVLKMFGDQLVGLTKERELMPSTSTYGQRSTASAHLPGAVIDEFSFTL